MQPPQPEDIIRIEMIDKPLSREPGEGMYEWRHMTDRYYVDIVGVAKDIDSQGPMFNSEFILDRLYNFTKVYINLRTGEVTT